MNVFTADGTTTGKTVMVWFYGGSLNFGGNAIRTYDGSSFAANQDIVLVVPNYRTNGRQSLLVSDFMNLTPILSVWFPWTGRRASD